METTEAVPVHTGRSEDIVHAGCEVSHKRIWTALIWLGLCVPTIGLCDQEQANNPIVVVSPGGRCYAKSVPSDAYGDGGSTNVFRVMRSSEDKIMDSFDWYSQRIHLICDVFVGNERSVVTVRLGPWARGFEATDNNLALAMYVDGREVANYSTLDIAGTPGNVERSVSHYEVFNRERCFGANGDGKFGFFASRFDGQILFFDSSSGEMNVVGNFPCR